MQFNFQLLNGNRPMSTTDKLTDKIFNIVVIVAALGYFVDIYDLILFSIVRVPSLKAIGIPDSELTSSGIFLMNMQMIGMIIGGIVWGILGDKRGRLSVLFFTILLYSLANLANGFVQNLDQYAILRIIAGFGLAGELGIGITLVSEVMTKERRGWGTSIVSAIGIVGAALAFAFAEWGWRQAYWAGGILGLLLLFLRVYVHESTLFNHAKSEGVPRGAFLSFFTSWPRFKKYLHCILIGVPVWFTIGILVTFSNVFAKAFGIPEINVGKVVMIHYMGAAIGSFLTGWISQTLRSRKKTLYISLLFLSLTCAFFFTAYGISVFNFFLLIFLLGVAQGYWAIFVTIAAEQFGTNLRSTATTTIPNFVRGAVVPLTLCWKSLKEGALGPVHSAILIAILTLVLAFFALVRLDETFGKELDYNEE